MGIGTNIRKIRKQLELSQYSVIKNIRENISQSTLSNIENERTPVDVHSPLLKAIADALGCTPEQIEQYDGVGFSNNVNQQGGQYIAKQYVSQEWVDILQSTISTLAEAQKNQQLILNAMMETNQQQQLMIGTLMKDLMKIKGTTE